MSNQGLFLNAVNGDATDSKVKPDELPTVSISFPLQSKKTVAGFGRVMSVEYMKTAINKYIELEGIQLGVGEDTVAITLGKESLLNLLSQKDCEGVRFYFCINPWGRKSICAVGVKVLRDETTGKPILDKDGSEIAQDIGIKSNNTKVALKSKGTEVYNTSILLNTDADLDDNILNYEVGPPFGGG